MPTNARAAIHAHGMACPAVLGVLETADLIDVRTPPIMAGMAARKKTKPSKRPARTTPRRPLGPGRSSGPRLTVVTLGVQSIARSRTFYEALGFRPSRSPNESIVFMDAGGVLLAL